MAKVPTPQQSVTDIDAILNGAAVGPATPAETGTPETGKDPFIPEELKATSAPSAPIEPEVMPSVGTDHQDPFIAAGTNDGFNVVEVATKRVVRTYLFEEVEDAQAAAESYAAKLTEKAKTPKVF